MKLLSLVFFAFLARPATAPKTYFGTWKITQVRSLTTERDAKHLIGQGFELQKNEMTYAGAFLWFTRECRQARLRTEPYRQSAGDPTTPEDYGLDHYPRESLVVRCVGADGRLTPTFSFEIVSADRLTIYWDGALVLMERD